MALRGAGPGAWPRLHLKLERWDGWASQMLARPTVGTTVEMLLPHYVDNELLRIRDLADLLVQRERRREDRDRNKEALTIVIRELLDRRASKRSKPRL